MRTLDVAVHFIRMAALFWLRFRRHDARPLIVKTYSTNISLGRVTLDTKKRPLPWIGTPLPKIGLDKTVRRCSSGIRWYSTEVEEEEVEDKPPWQTFQTLFRD